MVAGFDCGDLFIDRDSDSRRPLFQFISGKGRIARFVHVRLCGYSVCVCSLADIALGLSVGAT